ncbi:hypothetical protein HPB49_020646 [Dermacentor silvarum]|uniref:Uncharacterized protein n=1 Tax=Dermacentor silvarum TaxID=543639 RepID=A0ACB8E392_DERSI|nr:hypothetical protein HPB49_020646 [Dermacentor silvarum]
MHALWRKKPAARCARSRTSPMLLNLSALYYVAGSSSLASVAMGRALVSGFLNESFGRVRPIQRCRRWGLVSLAVPVVVAEICPPHVRGLLGSGGVLAVFVGGKWLNWLALELLCTVCPVLMTVAMAFTVESPRWLALCTVRFLYGPKFCAEAECLTIEASLLRQPVAVGDQLQRSFSLPLTYTLLLKIFQQFCGINVLTF